MNATDIALVGTAVFAYGMVARRLAMHSITAPMVFLTAGWVLGPGLGVLDIDFRTSGVRMLAEATLVLVLFADATRVDPRIMRRQFPMPGRLLAIGMPLTILLGGGLAYLLVDGLNLAESMLLAAVLAPTDAALGKAVVTDEAIPKPVRQVLNVESGLNDGLALPVVTALVAIAAAGAEADSAGHWILEAAREVGVGGAVGMLVGYVGGRGLDRAWSRDWIDGVGRQLTTLAVPVIGFGLAESMGGNGFIAAFVSGIAFAYASHDSHESAADLTEDVGELSTWMTFLLVGIGLVGPAIRAADPAVWVYATLSLTVVRMLPVAIALLGTHCAAVTGVFIGWFGPRGLATLLFALVIIDESRITNSETILQVASLVVALSVFLHGVTARRGGAAYVASLGAPDPAMPEFGQVDDMPVPRRGGPMSRDPKG